MINDISQQLQMPVKSSQPTSARTTDPLVETGSASLQKAQETVSAGLEKAAESQREANENLEETVSQLNDIVQTIERDLKFSIDESSGDTVITVLDTNSQEVIRQIPPEYVLTVRENLESLKGILFSAEI